MKVELRSHSTDFIYCKEQSIELYSPIWIGAVLATTLQQSHTPKFSHSCRVQNKLHIHQSEVSKGQIALHRVHWTVKNRTVSESSGHEQVGCNQFWVKVKEKERLNIQ